MRSQERYQLVEFLRDLWGGVGGMGEETRGGTGVLLWLPVTTELRLELFFILMEE